MEAIERDYSPRGVKFYYIYKALAHPETNGYISPFTLKERLMHVAEAKRKLGTRFTWLCDSMTNDLKHALGNAPNSEFLIDPQGKIVRARGWSNPNELRRDLEKLVGKVNNPTRAADLGMKRLAPASTVAKGVVPRLRVPARMSPLIVKPAIESAKAPFYVKLRAELESAYFQQGSGKLYLGFFLDPLHKVHWNNQAAPLSYEITRMQGVEIKPLKGTAAKIEQDADADPREFLVDVSRQSNERGRSIDSIKLTVRYFACDDAQTFCVPVSQDYEIVLQRDSDGGWRTGGGRGRNFNSARNTPGRPVASPRAKEDARTYEDRGTALKRAVAMITAHDANGDGKLQIHEWNKIDGSPGKADSNTDGELTLQELIDWLD